MADSYFWSPNMDMSDYYSGAMTPPTRLPGNTDYPGFEYGGYRVYSPPASPSPGLTTRTVNTVPVPMQAVTSAGVGLATGGRGSGSVTYNAPRAPIIANPLPSVRDLGSPQYGIPGSGGGVLTKSGLPPGATVEKTYTQRVPSQLPAIAGGYGKAGAGGFGSGSLTASMPSKTPDVINLSTVPMSEVSAQNTANSFGKPVRFGNGKTYYPSDVPMSGVRAPMKPVGNAPALPAQQQRGGLLSLFGSKGGILSTLFGGGASPRPAPVVTGGSPVLSNGVANPAYRDYGPQQSEGGGFSPANSFGGNGGGGFTDSLGGRYYDRHL